VSPTAAGGSMSVSLWPEREKVMTKNSACGSHMLPTKTRRGGRSCGKENEKHLEKVCEEDVSGDRRTEWATSTEVM
jgi:hypothetical protein